MVTNEEIAEKMLSDIEAYRENIKEIIIGRLMDSSHVKVYWDAWFRGATGKDLEAAERGVVYQGRLSRSELYLAKLGILLALTDQGIVDIQRIDDVENFREDFGLTFTPPRLESDEEAKRVFQTIAVDKLSELMD